MVQGLGSFGAGEAEIRGIERRKERKAVGCSMSMLGVSDDVG
jgi:hypothetical protein